VYIYAFYNRQNLPHNFFHLPLILLAWFLAIFLGRQIKELNDAVLMGIFYLICFFFILSEIYQNELVKVLINALVRKN